MSPYRLPALEMDHAPRADASFAWLAWIVWVGSVARVVLAAARHDAPDQELALAISLIVAIPYGMRRASAGPMLSA